MWSKSVPFFTLAGSGRGKHSVGKYSVRELFVPQHPVICQEAVGEGRIETGPHPALSGHIVCPGWVPDQGLRGQG